MKNLCFNENGLHMVFAVNDLGELLLIHLGTAEYVDRNLTPGELSAFRPVEIQVTGKNQKDHHGAKHTGTDCGGKLIYKNHTLESNAEGKLLTFALENENLNVQIYYQFYTGMSVIRSWTGITNISKESQGLEYVSSFSLTGIEFGGAGTPNEKLRVMIPHNTWTREFDWKTYTLAQLGFHKIGSRALKRIMASNTGTWSSKEFLPMGCVINTETTGSILWQIEHNGSWTWEISDLENKMYLKLSGPSENENGWWKNLLPGEKFESVKCAIAFSEGGFNGALAQLTEYRRKIAYRSNADKHLPVIFNDYMECLYADPTTEKEMPVIETAKRAGAEIFCMDAGWYADGVWWDSVGEWTVCERRFPGGIKEVFDKIKDSGMISGIWLEPEVMGINCPIQDQFDDDCFFMRHGKRIIDNGRYLLDFRNERVRKYLTDKVEWLIKELGIGYFKFDYNIDGGLGTEVNATSFGDGLLLHNRAFISWIDSLYEKHPDLIIENCASGGMRMDYMSLAHTSLQSLTDASSCSSMAVIGAASSTGVIPEQAAVWCVPKVDYTLAQEAICMVNAMFKRIHLSGHTHRLSDEAFERIKEGVDYYKSIRNEIPSLIPFYPIGLPDYDDNVICAGYKGKNKVYFTIVNLKGVKTISIPLKGIKCAKLTYGDGQVKTDKDMLIIEMENMTGAVIECEI
ncbi:MAG: alpha-galactosidase [Bacillota bacterium]|nr:alpha-galactosidase [Bacillota bacterium]